VQRWLLSCRVLGRGVEADVFDAMARVARERGASRLTLRCARLARNQPAQRYVSALLALAAAPSGGEEGSVDATFELRALAPAPRLLEEAPAARDETHSGAAKAPDWNEVAAFTRAPRSLATELGLASDGDHGIMPVVAGKDGILAVIGEVMGKSVGPGDNLYALGADSLRMMRILARLRDRLGISIPVGEFLYRADVSHVLALATRPGGDAASATPVDDEDFVGAFLRELRDDAEPTR
jgi:aryl carrier-like protein